MGTLRVLLLMAVTSCASAPPKKVAQPGPTPTPKPAIKPILAVFDLQAKGIALQAEARDRLSELLAVSMVEGEAFRVVPRDQLRGRLKQQKVQSYKACYDQRCQIAIGRELAANKALSTKIVRIGSSCTVTATLYDLKSATAERATHRRGSCNEKQIVAMLAAAAAVLSGKTPAAADPQLADDNPPPALGNTRSDGRPGSISLGTCDDCGAGKEAVKESNKAARERDRALNNIDRMRRRRR
jgi:uncharacterized protein YoaH (UPF0181 family)